jgi:hypothetical protein
MIDEKEKSKGTSYRRRKKINYDMTDQWDE